MTKVTKVPSFPRKGTANDKGHKNAVIPGPDSKALEARLQRESSVFARMQMGPRLRGDDDVQAVISAKGYSE